MKNNPIEISRAMKLLHAPGSVVELRALDASTADWRAPHTVSGYFDNFGQMANAADAIGTPVAIYFTLNEVNPALLARANNRVRNLSKKDSTTSDADILKRRWLLIDSDPDRPAGISSTNSEHGAALAKARQIEAFLNLEGWPVPILADSGNGAHLLYRIDLPTNDDGLISRVLKSLAAKFSGDGIKIDETVFNPSRICKLYGTVSRKGDNTPDRPHRLSKILEAPEDMQIVSKELLEELAGAPAESSHYHSSDRSSYLDDFIARNTLDLGEVKTWSGAGRRWVFNVCPWNSSHADGAAYLCQHSSGAIAAGCHHNGCAGNGWNELRKLHEHTEPKSECTYRPACSQSSLAPAHTQQAGTPAAVVSPPVENAPRREKRIWIPPAAVIEIPNEPAAGARVPLSQRKPHDIDELLAFDPKTDPDALFEGRFLSRGDGCLIVGETGKGKSSLAVQAALFWALGRPFFGITPKRALKVLIIQAENNRGDLSEQFQGVVRGSNLENDLPQIRSNVFPFDEYGLTGDDFISELQKTILKWKPDWILIDPLFSYIGGDISRQEVCSHFLRARLNPVLKDCGCACIMVHHTNKPNAEGTGSRLYAGSGSADVINWARAQINLEDKGDGTFELHLPKRGNRSGLCTPDQAPAAAIRIMHSTEGICWKYADSQPAARQEGGKSEVKYTRGLSTEDCLAALTETPMQRSSKDERVKTWRTELRRLHPGIAWGKIDDALRVAVQDSRAISTPFTDAGKNVVNAYSISGNGRNQEHISKTEGA